MKARQIRVGEVYEAKVGGYLVPVRIDSEKIDIRTGHTTWEGTNLVTNRKVYIRSPRRLYWCLSDKTVDGPHVCPICGRRAALKITPDANLYVHKVNIGRHFGKVYRAITEHCRLPKDNSRLFQENAD